LAGFGVITDGVIRDTDAFAVDLVRSCALGMISLIDVARWFVTDERFQADL